MTNKAKKKWKARSQQTGESYQAIVNVAKRNALSRAADGRADGVDVDGAADGGLTSTDDKDSPDVSVAEEQGGPQK